MQFIRASLAFLAIVFACAVHAQASNAPPTEVNVNTADAQTIASVLTGVGLKKAEAIVAHREQHGRFDAAADLAKVKGIGPATVAKNADKIVVTGGADAPAEPSGTDPAPVPEPE